MRGWFSGASSDDDLSDDIARHAPRMVFGVVNSPETAHLIDPAVREWSADSRPVGVDTKFTIRGHLGIIPIRGTSQVAVWDPPRLSEFRSVAPV